MSKLNKNNISEDEDSDLIINTDDFTSINEFRINIKKEKPKEKQKEKENGKSNEVKETNPSKITNINRHSESINNIYNDNDNDKKLVGQKKINNYLYNLNNNDTNNLNDLNDENIVSNYNDERTIFSKIAEDLYINNLDNIKRKNNILDFSKIKEDNYNRLTTENYFLHVQIKKIQKMVK